MRNKFYMLSERFESFLKLGPMKVLGYSQIIYEVGAMLGVLASI